MAIDPLLLKALKALAYANGAYVIVACALAGVLFLRKIRSAPAVPAAGLAAPATFALFALFAALAIAYAFYPNFIDHAEPAMATLGVALLGGRPLYPGPEAYTFHGLLYGPLAAEIQAGAIFLGSRLGDLPVVLASKLAGVLAFFLACACFVRAARGWGFASAYALVFLLPFAALAFWNRCEPVFLLLVAAGFWAVDACPRRISRRSALLALGIGAGLASGLKLHGFLYMAPAAMLLLSRGGIASGEILLLAGAAAASFLLLFLPGGVSLASFFGYLASAAGHGLSAELFLTNLAFIGALWSPLLAACAAGGRWRLLREPGLLALAALQLGVAVIGSKPGAGIHHLLPFIPANALFFANRIEAQDARHPASRLVWAAALLPGLAACALLALGMARDWRTYERASQELRQIQAKYPDLVMGVGGSSFYPYAFLRPVLALNGPPQVEYSSFMDLHLIGVADTPLREAFDGCRIGHLAVPRREAPFSVATYYAPKGPLFSDELRAAFERRYVKVGGGIWYDAYECVPRKD